MTSQGNSAAPSVEGFLRVIRPRIEAARLKSDPHGPSGAADDDRADLALTRIADLAPIEAHDLVTAGLPVSLARNMANSYEVVEREAIFKAIGIGKRTIQRNKGYEQLLDPGVSDRLLHLALVMEQATDVMGSPTAAERWLVTPAIGLDQRRPIDLLRSSAGFLILKTLLTRMDYGVYA